MKTLAAVLVELGQPLELADLDIPVLKPGQTLVEIACSGVCHTQVLEARGHRGVDRYLPHCLGHEGAGIVRDVGPSVCKVRADQRVVLSWIKGSGADVSNTAYRWGGRNVNAGAITTFSRYAVISENRLTPVNDDLPFDEAALLGCAVPTGVGVVLNTAQPRPGQSLVVFGVGGIGLCAVAGAALAGCLPIIAVDVCANKLSLARQMGATHAVQSGLVTHDSTGDPVAAIQNICPGGVDFAIEATGRPLVMQQALDSVRQQGGAAVVVGNARFGERLDLDPRQLNQGKRLLGTWGGDNWPDRDFPCYTRLLNAGKLAVKPLLSRRYPLSEINLALDDLERGTVPRPLIQMDLE